MLSLGLMPSALSQVIHSQSPLRGWNSWDSYGKYPTEAAILKNIESFKETLKPAGYEYVVIDAGWNIEKDKNNQITHLAMDNYGRYIPAKTAFPQGITFIADRVHEAGLKFGIHVMRGIPREAYRKNLKIAGTPYTARDIADTSSICSWNSDNYGVAMNRPGAQEYYDSYIGLLIDWGVDFIKADDMTAHPAEIAAVVKAIEKKKKPVVLSLSPGEGSDSKNAAVYNKATMLRITRDIWDNEMSIHRAFDAWKKWSEALHGRTFLLDMDMIPFGHLCLHNPNPGYTSQDLKEEGKKNVRGLERMSTWSKDQQYTFITLLALSASPLMMGGNLPTSDDFSMELITNPDMLLCNQNGITGKIIYDRDGIEIWKTVSRNSPDCGWIGVFNRKGDERKVISINHKILGLKDATIVHDIWKDKTYGRLKKKKNIKVNANGVVFLKYGDNKQ